MCPSCTLSSSTTNTVCLTPLRIVEDTLGVERVVSTSHADQFVQYFQDAVNNIQKDLTTTTKSVDALGEAYKLNIQAPGIIYLFMGSPASAPSPGYVDNYLEQKINTQVNVFYTPQKSGTYPHLPTDPQTSILIQAVKQSGGRYLPLSQNSVSQMTPMLVSSTRAKDLVFEYGLSVGRPSFSGDQLFRHATPCARTASTWSLNSDKWS